MTHLPIADVSVPLALIPLLGVAIGAIAGFFGVGGGFLLTPLLNALFGVPYSVAVGSGLSQMAGLSAAASVRHGYLGGIDLRLGLICVVGASAGAEVGAQALEALGRCGEVSLLGASLPVETLVMSVAYVVTLGFMGTRIRAEARRTSASRDADGEPHTQLAQRLRSLRLPPMVALPASGIASVSVWGIAAVTFVSGVASGFLGVGGGFLLMPAMIYVLGVPTIVAVGTSLFQMIFVSAYGALSHSLKGNVDPVLALLLLLGSTVGTQIGASLTRRFDPVKVRAAFAYMVFSGVLLVVAKLVQLVLAGG